MNNEFIQKLEEDEKILFYSMANVDKTSMQLGRLLFAIIVLILFWVLFGIGIKNEALLNYKIIVIFITLIILTITLIYGLVYNVYLKYNNKNNEYFITNKRIAIYNFKKGFEIRNLSDIEHIGIAREKDNYADIIFNFSNTNLIDKIRNTFSFEGVENPRKAIEIIIQQNKNIHFYDDRPTYIGKKI